MRDKLSIPSLSSSGASASPHSSYFESSKRVKTTDSIRCGTSFYPFLASGSFRWFGSGLFLCPLPSWIVPMCWSTGNQISGRGGISLEFFCLSWALCSRVWGMCKSIGLGVTRVIRARSVMSASLAGVAIRIILGKLSCSFVSQFPLHSLLFSSRHVTSRRVKSLKFDL